MSRFARLAATTACVATLIATASAAASAGTAAITFANCTFTAATSGGPPPTAMTAFAAGSSASCGPGITGTLDADIGFSFVGTAALARPFNFTLSGFEQVCHYSVSSAELILDSAGPPTWTYSGPVTALLDRDTSGGSCPVFIQQTMTVALTP
jgi:hypothetical protein